MSTSTLRTRNQHIAEKAWEVFGKRKPRTNEYDSFARNFPAMIHSSGLCQAVAFAQAKGRDQVHVLEDVARVVQLFAPKVSDGESFMDQARTSGGTEYMRLTRLAIAAAGYLKRYSEANPVASGGSSGDSKE